MTEELQYKLCEKATFLIEKRMDIPLSLSEKVSLAGHLCICKACKIYAKQSKIIDASMEKLISQELNFEASILKQRILTSLENL